MKNKNYSDWLVALSVVACSAVLFAALALALSGTMISKPGHLLRVNFHDVTGINLGARVKYAGAPVGKVSAIRILSNEERVASSDPLNVVELTLALDKGIPKLAVDTKASLSADTLLSDKFILLNGGSDLANFLAENAVIQGTTPTTFDKLARDIDGAINGLRTLMGETKSGAPGDIFAQIKALLTDAQSVVTDAKPMLQDVRPVLQDAKALASDGRQLASDARQLLSDNKAQITSAIGHADKAAGAFEQLGTTGNNFLTTNAPKLTGTIADFKVTGENLKITSTYAKILMRNVNLKPSQLLWGTAKPPVLPSEAEILRSPKVIPAN